MLADLRLGAHDALRQRTRRGEKGLGYLLGGQAADLAQGERNPRFRRQRGMAAGKDQAQAVILEDVLFLGALRRASLRFEISHQLVLRRIESCPATQRINSFESGCRNQPWAWVVGHSTLRPQAQRRRKGFMHRLLGKIEITEQADQRSQDSSRIHPIKGVEQFAYRLGGTLGHDHDLSKPATPNQFSEDGSTVKSNPEVKPQKRDSQNQASGTRGI